MGIDLPLIWAVIIIFGIMMYVVMDYQFGSNWSRFSDFAVAVTGALLM